MKSLIATIASALLLAAASLAEAQPFAYIPNQGSNNVSVINTVTNTVVATVAVGSGPFGVAINPAGTRTFVTNFGSNNVSVINTATSTVVATVAVGGGAAGVVVNPAGTRAYVGNFSSNNVSVIDTATNTVVATVAVGVQPTGVAVNPAGTRVYVAHQISNNVSVIDTANNTVIATVPGLTGAYGVAVNPAGTRAYVTNSGGGNVSVIDTATNTVIATVAAGSAPTGVAVNPAGTRAYVVNQGSNNVSVIDTATNLVVATAAVGSLPVGVAVNPAGTRAYVTNQTSNNVSVIDTATNVTIATVVVGTSPVALGVFIGGPAAIVPGAPTIGTATAGNASATVSYTPPAFNGGSTITTYTATSNPGGIQGFATGGPIIVNGLTNGTAYTFTVTATNGIGVGPPSAPSNSVTPVAPPPPSSFAYISNNGSNNVSVINTATNTVVATVAVGSGPFGVAVNPAGARAYVSNQSSNNVSVINTATNTVVATVTVGTSPTGVAVNPAGTRVYVANANSNSVSVIDTATNSVVATVPVGVVPFLVAVNPAGTRAYVANFSTNNVSVIDTATNTVVATVAAGTGSYGVAINPAGTRAYVSNQTSSNVSVIDTATNTVVATVPAGSIPSGVAVNPAGTRVYVANTTSNNVTVIDTSTNTVVATLAAGTGPLGVSVNPAGTRAYVANFGSNNVSVIDTATNLVVATVPVGASPYALGSFISGSATATVPGAPTAATAVAGNASATVSYTPPASNGGSTITTYTATSNPGGIQGFATGGPIVVNGLTNGTAYTFTVTATNGVGVGPPSTPSNSVTPTGPPPPSFAYITNTSSANVSVINTATNTVVATVAVGTDPSGIAVNPAGTRVYVANEFSNNVSVIDTATNTVVATVAVGAVPLGVAVNPAGTRAYVANFTTNNVSVIDTATNSVVATAAVGSAPVGVAVNPAGTRAYVVNQNSNNVSVIDTATNSVVATAAVGSAPFGVAVNPAGTRAYVANVGGNNVSVIDTATNSVVATVAVLVSPGGVAVNPAGTRVYVTNSGSNSVSVIDTATNTVAATVTVGSGPVGVAINPAGTRGYVANSSNNNVSVFDTATNLVVATVVVGLGPRAFGLFIGTPPAATVPGAPTAATAVAGDGVATVSYTAPASNGGSTITTYTATSNPGGIQGFATGGPIVVNGLTNGTAYTFTVTATNGIGVGPPSAPSNSVTPTAALVACQFIPTSGSWIVPANWSNCASGNGAPAGTPGTANRADISGKTAILPTGTLNVGEINLSGVAVIQGTGLSTSTLNVVAGGATSWGTGSYTFRNMTVAFTSSIPVDAQSGSLTVDTSVLSVSTQPSGMVASAVTITGTGAKISNGGIFFVGSSVTMTAGGVFENNATGIFFPGGPAVTISGSFVNQGTLLTTVNSIITLANAAAFSQPAATGFIVGDGAISAVGQVLTVANGFIGDNVTFTLGTLANTGAVLAPGGPGTIGTITVNGNYTSGPAASVEIEIAAGMPFPVFDQLVVSGTSSLAGTANFFYIDDGFGTYVPVQGNALNFITTFANTGLFSSFTFPPSGNVVSVAYFATAVQFLVGPPTGPAITVTGTTTFPSTAVGASSAVQPITITNNGTATLTITSITHSNASVFPDTTGGPAPNATHYCGFGSAAGGVPNTGGPINIAPAASCVLNLIFSPNTAGALTGTITVNSNAPTSPTMIAVSGTGLPPPSTITPASIAFGNVPLTVPITQTVTFNNPSALSYTITTLGTSDARFTAVGSGANPCNFGAIVAPAGACTFSLTFTPNGAGAFNNTTTVSFVPNGDGATYTRTQPSNGTGFAPPASVTPSSVLFGNVVVGTPASQSFVFTNDSNTTLFPSTYTLTSLTTSGLGFTAVGSGGTPCATGLTLAPGASCGATITFLILVTGASNGTTTIGFLAGLGSNPAYSRAVATNGTGVAAGTTPSLTVAFAPATVAINTNAALTLTLTNPTASSAFISSGSVTIPAGLAATAPPSNTCGTFGTVSGGVYSFGMGSIPAMGSCTIVLNVQSPTAAGYTVSVAPGALNAGGASTNTSAATLTVTALLPPTISFAVAPTSIAVGGTSVGTLTINNPNAVPLTANPVLFNYLPGLVNAPVPSASSTCAGANITATPGAGSYTQNTSFTLPPSGSCTFSATITSNTAGIYSGNIAAGLIVTPAGSSNATPFSITVTPAPAPAVTLTPPSVNFGTRTINTTSPAQVVTLTNSGTLNLVISSITGSGDFGFTSTCPLLTPPLPPAAPCAINITFTPLTVAALSGTITVTSNAPGSPHTIALAGTGASVGVPNVSLAPTSLNFGAQAINTASFVGSIIVSNTGFANLIFSSVSVSGPFGRVALAAPVPPDCGASLAPGSSCQIGVVFSPTTIGAQSGQVSIIDNAAGSPRFVPLSGTGTVSAVPTIAANAALAFGDQIINTTSAAQNLTVSNTGAAPLNISAITLTGANAGDFAVTGQSGCVSIAPAASCALSITFLTTTVGAKTAQINITSNAQNAAVVTTSLSGNGILAPRAVVNVTTTTIGFGNVIFGGAAPNQAITLTNSGGQALTIGSIVLVGDFVQMNNCGTSLAGQASCTVNIVFTPLAQGVRLGELILTSNAATSPNRIPLSGTGCRWFSQAQSRLFLTSC